MSTCFSPTLIGLHINVGLFDDSFIRSVGRLCDDSFIRSVGRLSDDSFIRSVGRLSDDSLISSIDRFSFVRSIVFIYFSCREFHFVS